LRKPLFTARDSLRSKSGRVFRVGRGFLSPHPKLAKVGRLGNKKGAAELNPTTPEEGTKKAKEPPKFRGSFACDCLPYGFYSATGYLPEKGKTPPAIRSSLSLCFFAPTLYPAKPLISSPQPLALPLEDSSSRQLDTDRVS